MKFMPTREIFLQIGNYTIMWYAVLILAGVIITSALSIHNFKKNGYTSNDFFDFLLPVLVFGIIGARIWYVIFMWEKIYQYYPAEIIRIDHGGLAIQGGVILGMIVAFIVARIKKMPILLVGDCIMPNVLIAQAIGRWGNFVNQEAFGSECSLEFLKSLKLPQFIIDGMYINGRYWHPTFLYESILNIIGFLIIIFIIKKLCKDKHGILFGSYFIWYGIIRFFVEALRTDSLMFMGLKMAQITSIAFLIIGILLIIFSLKQKPTKLYSFLLNKPKTT